MLRTERFLDYFQKGKDETAISHEMAYFKTALVIDAYVNQPDSMAMIAGINNDDALLLSLRQYSHQNFFKGNSEKGLFAGAYGTLLYAILATEDYCSLSNLVDGEELGLLDSMSTSLKSLYSNYRSRPTEHLNQLILSANQWFTIKHQNPEQAKQLTLSLFATLSICSQAILKVDTLPWTIKSLITNLIATETFKTRLEDVLETARTTIDLESKSIPTIIITNDDGSIEHLIFFNDRPVIDKSSNSEAEDDVFEDCMNTSEQVENHQQQNPLPLLTVIDDPSDSETEDDVFEDCIDISEPVENHQEQSHPPLLTIDAYYDKQFRDILSQNQPSLSEKIRLIKTTLDSASELIQTLLNQKHQLSLLESELDSIQAYLIHQDEAQEAARRIPTKLYYTGLFVSAFVSSFVKMNTPEIIRQGINSVTPERPLPLEKQRMLALVGTSNNEGQPITMSEIQILESQINHTIQILVGDNNELRQLFIKASELELSELSERMRADSELMDRMAKLIDTVKNNQRTLKKAKTIDTKLDSFILQHDGILVEISLLLSRYIHSFFKTDTAEKIERARLIKEELSHIKLTYQTLINDINLNIQNFPIMPVIPALTKTTIARDISAHHALLDTEEITSDASANIHSQFNNINTLFQPLKTEHAAMIITNRTTRNHEL